MRIAQKTNLNEKILKYYALDCNFLSLHQIAYLRISLNFFND